MDFTFRAGPFTKIAIPANPPFAGSFDWDRMAGGHPINGSVKYQSVDLAGFSFGTHTASEKFPDCLVQEIQSVHG
ncbi:hypothetical protein [Paraburkholderia hospita]|uniref:hypothetical protein n=1 Tax=Paraburkholderia hospita TaxID=169430 RepID=UPI001178B19E|nr:hypothetical protein [Paraburkholderia hospita]